MARPFDPRRFYEEVLKANGIVAAFGVPDSSLSGLLSYFSATKPVSEHIVTANEGGAVALAAGYYLSTRKVALAYMQNSGLANALNPLQSLAAKEVFGLPMLLMIGWRGKPGEKDEPQHALIGPRILDNLRANDFPYEEIPDTLSGAKEAVARLVAKSMQDNTPVALIVPTKTFLDYNDEALQNIPPAIATSHAKLERWITSASVLPLSRELAIRCLLGNIKNSDVVVSSLGGNSRELYMIRKENGEAIGRDFFCIGAMGHTFALAYGITMGSSSRRVFCIDGDGSFLMHVGNNAVLAGVSYPNVIHVVIYNGIHSSTGNQPLMIRKDDFLAMAEGLTYKQKLFVDNAEGLIKACESAIKSTLIIVAVNDSVRKNLPRPSESPRELKGIFMKSFA
jgi:phosphonopyruvate decarboxylase